MKGNRPEEVTAIMNKYYDSLGIPNNLSSRARKDLVPRVALANAIVEYYTLTSIGKAMGKDHATIIHYTKMDETYSLHYKSYVYFKKGARKICEILFGEKTMVETMLERIDKFRDEFEDAL